ncbi:MULTISPECIES: hypothetical protein [unclassified Mycolicibacterium]|uniref:hypothetical protein n=1 Tax=unclassified Mycolicibacterium TaxID=2636767 RepID=UPI002ED9E94E
MTGMLGDTVVRDTVRVRVRDGTALAADLYRRDGGPPRPDGAVADALAPAQHVVSGR